VCMCVCFSVHMHMLSSNLMHWFSVTQIKCKDYCYQVTTQLQLVVISSSSKIS